MSGTLTQLIESAQHLPRDAENPLGGAAALLATGIALTAMRLGFNRTDEAYAAEFPNPALLEKSITPDDRANRSARLGAAVLEVAGVGLIAASLIGHPTYSTSKVNSQANVIVVDDVSNSMRFTRDLGQSGASRSEAVTAGIDSVSYTGKLGVIQVAANHNVAVPLSQDWRTQKARIAKLSVDANGGQLTPALQLAESLLPLSRKVAGGHEGTVVLISDGTVDDSGNSIANEASTMTRDGVKLKVIVPGTANGTYKLNVNAPPADSGVQPQLFNGVGANNISQPQTAEAVTSDVRQQIEDAGSVGEQHPWLPAVAFGIAMGAVGLFRNVRQRASRKV